MKTIKQAGEIELEIKKSRFRCALRRTSDAATAREFVRQRRKLHHEARHHCSAYVLGADAGTRKSHDDGEPAGTAGAPMLDVLCHNEITNCVAVVTRYFGGVLLGAGGLVRAYGGAVSAALEQVGVVELRPMRVLTTTVDYGLAGRLENQLRSTGQPGHPSSTRRIADIEYGAEVRFELHVEESGIEAFEQWLAEVSGGAAVPTRGAIVYTEVDV